MDHSKIVLLSFDIEEFDVPAEHGVDLVFTEQIRISCEGTERILDLLGKHNIKATFFTTVVFAQQEQALIKRIIAEGHELGSHGWFHSKFDISHLERSRQELVRMFDIDISGFRMARMMEVDSAAIRDAGYKYNSSLNPVWLPGRYNNFFAPRTAFEKNRLFHVPASATPILRIPLFWLSFHHLPMWMYKAACVRTMQRDGYLNIYFHPWEFFDLSRVNGLPWMLTHASGDTMQRRFDHWISWLKGKGYLFERLQSFAAHRTKVTTEK